MKVNGPKAAQAASGAKKAGAAKRTSGASFSDSLSAGGSVDSAGESAPTVGAGPAAALDALLALQEVDTAGDALSQEKRRKAVKWGEDLLDGLEEIRNGLLMGVIPLAKLERLATALKARQTMTQDPKLASVLTDIELRARVEIAKLRQS